MLGLIWGTSDIMRLFISTLIFGFVCFWGSNALASLHHHRVAQHQSVSPFDKEKDGRSLHCALSDHMNAKFCPHSLLPNNGTTNDRISSDCENGPSGTTPGFSAHSFKIFSTAITHFESKLFLTRQQLISLAHGISFSPQKQIDHPPQTI